MSSIEAVAESQTIEVSTETQTIVVDPVTLDTIVVESPAGAISVVSGGPQGPPGTSFTFRGEWESDTEYFINDVVTYFGFGGTGCSYIAIAQNTGFTPTSTNKWAIFAAKGDDGVPGPIVNFDALLNVDTSGKSNGSIPKWNSTTNKWEAASDSAPVTSVDGRTGVVDLSDEYLALSGGVVDTGDGKTLIVNDSDYNLRRQSGVSTTDVTLNIGGIGMMAKYDNDRQTTMEMSQTYINFGALDNLAGQQAFFEVGSGYISFYISSGAVPTINGDSIATVPGSEGYTDGAVSDHLAATDPHGDRSYADTVSSTARSDAESFATSAISTHTSAVDPHGDRAYAEGLFNSNDAMIFKGTIDCRTNPDFPAADRGWFYKIEFAGKIGGSSGVNVEAGDSIICSQDGSLAGNDAAVGESWYVIQANIDGAVIGPVSSTNGHVAVFDGSTGKLISDGGALGSAAFTDSSAYEPSGSVSTHAGATDPHGDRAYAAGLVDDLSGVSNQATAQANLGLGTAAIADATDFDASGTATTTVSNHVAATDPHGDRAYADGLAVNYMPASVGATKGFVIGMSVALG